MSIRQKTLGSAGIIVMVLVAVMTTTTYFGVTGRFARLEIKEVEAQVHRVQNELNATLANLESMAADRAPWDDTYRFVEDANPEYVENNLVDSTFADLRLNFMFFFNSRGKLVYGRCFDLVPVVRSGSHHPQPPGGPGRQGQRSGRYGGLLTASVDPPGR